MSTLTLPVSAIDLAVQRGLLNQWKWVGLDRLAPAYFDNIPEVAKGADGKERPNAPPYAQLEIKLTDLVRSVLSETRVMACTGRVWLPQGDGRREEIETKLASITKTMPVVDGRPMRRFRMAKELELTKDVKTFAGKPMNQLPLAWEFAVEIKNHGA